jgi:hypothetical protein
MNDKDKEAFDKWLKENYSSLIKHGGLKKMDADFELCWLSACEYMRNKYTPLDALSLYEKLEREREENKKLREALEWCLSQVGYASPWWIKINKALKEIGE